MPCRISRKVVASQGFHKEVNMRGHDDGCVKPVSFAVETQKTLLDRFTGIYVRQGTGTKAGIEPGFDLFIETSVVFFPLGVCPRFGVALVPQLTRFLEGPGGSRQRGERGSNR